MTAATAMVSIGDAGVLNQEVSQSLSEVWIDRDLGWLDFNDRVLAEALDERTPLLERVKLLAKIRERLIESLRNQADCFRHRLVPELAKHGIHLRKWDDLTEA